MSEKILIIDDDLDTLKLAGLMLQKQGFRVVIADSGIKGLELAQSESPDLILLDVMMPGMDGHEVARRLRAAESTADIPILMFTAKSQLEDKVAGFQAGADDYLTKPTHPAELQVKVKALLARSAKNRVAPPAPKEVEQPAYIIGMLAARGGLGVTTISSNLASYLSIRTGTDVILAEFRPGQGTLALDLALKNEHALGQLLNTDSAGITRSMVEERLEAIQDGTRILASSGHPRDCVLVENIPQFETILNRMEFMARYVVVDLGCGLTPLNQKLVHALQELILVVEPYENSLLHSQCMLDDLAAIGMDMNRVFAVINYRLRSDIPQLSVSQIHTYLKCAIDVSFTPAPELYMQASRRHLLASMTTQDTVTEVQYNNLVNRVEARARKKMK